MLEISPSRDRARLRRLGLETRDDLRRLVVRRKQAFSDGVGSRDPLGAQPPLVRRCLNVDLRRRVLDEDQVPRLRVLYG